MHFYCMRPKLSPCAGLNKRFRRDEYPRQAGELLGCGITTLVKDNTASLVVILNPLFFVPAFIASVDSLHGQPRHVRR